MPRQFYDQQPTVSEPSLKERGFTGGAPPIDEDPPINPIWKPDYDREPHWKDLDENDIEIFYDRVRDYVDENEEVDNIQWDRMNYNIVDADFYREKIGDGFPEAFYELLADSTNEENKIQDFRQPTLDIKNEEIVLKFSTEPIGAAARVKPRLLREGSETVGC